MTKKKLLILILILIIMSMTVWGLLTKSAEDATKIEEEIDDRIASHNADPDSHGLADMALYAHRTGDVLDHLDEAVKNVKVESGARAFTAIVDPASVVSPIILRPNGAGSETNIDSQNPDSDAHWDKVDDVTPDEYTTCVYTYSDTYQRDLYDIETSAETKKIISVAVFFCCRVDDVGALYVRAKSAIKTHNVVYDGEEKELSITFRTYWKRYKKNPNTGLDWTWDEVNALEAGVSLKGEVGSKLAACTQVYVAVFTEPEAGGDFIDIQEAIDYVEELGVGTIFLKSGNFTISLPLVISKSDIIFSGQGLGTVLTLADNINDDVIKLDVTTADVERVTLKDFKINGNGANQSAGRGIASIAVKTKYNLNDLTIKNLEITACKEEGIEFESKTYSKRCLIENNYIHDNLDKGIYIINGEDNLVTNNIIKDNASISLYFNSGVHNLAINNRVDGGTAGIRLSNVETKSIINGNLILNSSGDGILLQDGVSYSSIENNFIENCKRGVRLNSFGGGVCKFNVIADNIILDSNDEGISIRNNTDNADATSKNVINSNTISNSGEHGIFVEGAQYNSIIGNTFDGTSKDTDDTYSDIFLTDNGKVIKSYSIYNTVTGNAINCSGANKSKYGIRENDANNNFNIILGNIVQGAVTANISIQGANTEVGHNIE